MRGLDFKMTKSNAHKSVIGSYLAVTLVFTLLLLISTASVSAINLNPFGNSKSVVDTWTGDKTTTISTPTRGGQISQIDTTDTTQEPTSDYPIVQIDSQFLWLDSGTVAQYQLLTNDNQCLIDCEAYGKAQLFRDSQLFEDLNFIDKDGKDTSTKDFNIYIKVDEEHTETVDDYIMCTGTNEDTKTTFNYSCPKGSHQETSIVTTWIPYDFTALKAGYYEWKIVAKKNPLEAIDWIVKAQGLNLDEYAWWNNSWSYKQNITLVPASTVKNSSIPINVTYNAHMNVDFSDVRFTNGTEDGELSYWIENETNSSTALFWVNYPATLTSGTNTSIMMYYGNAGATSKSNGNNTFLFFDNFDSLDTNRWTNAAGYTIDTGNNSLKSAGGDGNTYYTKAGMNNFTDYISTTRYYITGGNTGNFYGRLDRTTASPNPSYLIDYESTGTFMYTFTGFTNVNSTATTSSADSWDYQTSSYFGNNLTITLNQVNSWNRSITNINNRLTGISTYADKGGVGFRKGGNNNAFLVDWITIRNYTAVDPNMTFGNEQTITQGGTLSTLLNSPSNSSTVNTGVITSNGNSSVTLSANASATGNQYLLNITYYLWNSSGNNIFLSNITLPFTNTTNQTTVTASLPNGVYTWNSLAYSNASSAWNSLNYTFTMNATLETGSISTQLNYPKSNDVYNTSSVSLSANATASGNQYLKNITYYIYNVSNSVIISQQTVNLPLVNSTNVSLVTASLINGTYKWNAQSFSNVSNAWGSNITFYVNFTVVNDVPNGKSPYQVVYDFSDSMQNVPSLLNDSNLSSFITNTTNAGDNYAQLIFSDIKWKNLSINMSNVTLGFNFKPNVNNWVSSFFSDGIEIYYSTYSNLTLVDNITRNYPANQQQTQSIKLPYDLYDSIQSGSSGILDIQGLGLAENGMGGYGNFNEIWLNYTIDNVPPVLNTSLLNNGNILQNLNFPYQSLANYNVSLNATIGVNDSDNYMIGTYGINGSLNACFYSLNNRPQAQYNCINNANTSLNMRDLYFGNDNITLIVFDDAGGMSNVSRNFTYHATNVSWGFDNIDSYAVNPNQNITIGTNAIYDNYTYNGTANYYLVYNNTYYPMAKSSSRYYTWQAQDFNYNTSLITPQVTASVNIPFYFVFNLTNQSGQVNSFISGLDYSTITSDILIGNQTYPSNALVTSSQYFSVNVSYNPINASSSLLGYLVFNNVSYLSNIQKLNSTFYILSNTINMPAVVGNYSFNWNITFGGTFNYATSPNTVNVNGSINIDNCSANNKTILKFDLFDEDTRAAMNGTIKVSANLYNLDHVSLVTSYNNTFNYDPSLSNAKVCINVAGNSLLDYTAEYYNGTNYAVEYKYGQNLAVNSTTIQQNISLFDILASPRSTTFTIQVQDTDLSPVLGAIVDVQRNYIDLNQFLSVESPLTDVDGNAITSLVQNEVVYNFVVSQNGLILGTFNNYKVKCGNQLTGDCNIILNLISSSSTPQDYKNYGGISINPTFDPNNRVVSVGYASADGLIHTVSVVTILNDGYGNTTICSINSTGTIGTITCPIPSATGNTSISTSVSSDGTFLGIMTNYYGDNTNVFGNTGKLFALIMYSTLVLLFMGNPVIMVIGSILGIVCAGLLFFTTGGNILGIGSILIWVIVAAAIIIDQVRRRI